MVTNSFISSLHMIVSCRIQPRRLPLGRGLGSAREDRAVVGREVPLHRPPLGWLQEGAAGHRATGPAGAIRGRYGPPQAPTQCICWLV